MTPAEAKITALLDRIVTAGNVDLHVPPEEFAGVVEDEIVQAVRACAIVGTLGELRTLIGAITLQAVATGAKYGTRLGCDKTLDAVHKAIEEASQ